MQDRTTRVFDVRVVRDSRHGNPYGPFGMLVVIADSLRRLRRRRSRRRIGSGARRRGPKRRQIAEAFVFTRRHVAEMTVVRAVASVHGEVEKAK